VGDWKAVSRASSGNIARGLVRGHRSHQLRDETRRQECGWCKAGRHQIVIPDLPLLRGYLLYFTLRLQPKLVHVQCACLDGGACPVRKLLTMLILLQKIVRDCGKPDENTAPYFGWGQEMMLLRGDREEEHGGPIKDRPRHRCTRCRAAVAPESRRRSIGEPL